MQIESVAEEDTQVYIERLEKRVDLINGEKDTDTDTEDGEPGDEDKEDSFKKIIKQALEELEERRKNICNVVEGSAYTYTEHTHFADGQYYSIKGEP